MDRETAQEMEGWNNLAGHRLSEFHCGSRSISLWLPSARELGRRREENSGAFDVLATDLYVRSRNYLQFLVVPQSHQEDSPRLCATRARAAGWQGIKRDGWTETRICEVLAAQVRFLNLGLGFGLLRSSGIF